MILTDLYIVQQCISICDKDVAAEIKSSTVSYYVPSELFPSVVYAYY